MAFFYRFWDVTNECIIAFMSEFHAGGKLSEQMGATFILKKTEAESIKKTIVLAADQPHWKQLQGSA